MSMREALRNLPEAVFADVLESDDAYLFVFDLPGVTAETLEVRIEGQKLRLEASREKTTPPEFEYLEEERSLFVDATVPLPPDVSESGGTATIDRGVLELRLPKSTGTDGTTIDVA